MMLTPDEMFELMINTVLLGTIAGIFVAFAVAFFGSRK